jgi:hypothetical protein
VDSKTLFKERWEEKERIKKYSGKTGIVIIEPG